VTWQRLARGVRREVARAIAAGVAVVSPTTRGQHCRARPQAQHRGARAVGQGRRGVRSASENKEPRVT